MHARAARLVELSQRWRVGIEALARSLAVSLGGTLRFARCNERRLATAMSRDAPAQQITERVRCLDSGWTTRGTAPFGLIRHGIYRPAEQRLQQAARDLASARIAGKPVDIIREAPAVLRHLELSGIPSGQADLGRVRHAFDRVVEELKLGARSHLSAHPGHAAPLQVAVVAIARALGEAMQRFQEMEAFRTAMTLEREAAVAALLVPPGVVPS